MENKTRQKHCGSRAEVVRKSAEVARKTAEMRCGSLAEVCGTSFGNPQKSVRKSAELCGTVGPLIEGCSLARRAAWGGASAARGGLAA